MMLFGRRSSNLRRTIITLGLAGTLFSGGCAQHGGSGAQASAPVPAPAIQPLPEHQNAARYRAPVAETEVVRVFGYPVVDQFDSKAL